MVKIAQNYREGKYYLYSPELVSDSPKSIKEEYNKIFIDQKCLLGNKTKIVNIKKGKGMIDNFECPANFCYQFDSCGELIEYLFN